MIADTDTIWCHVDHLSKLHLPPVGRGNTQTHPRQFNKSFRKYPNARTVTSDTFILKVTSDSTVSDSSTRLWRVDFAVRQVDFQLTCLDGQVEISEKHLYLFTFTI